VTVIRGEVELVLGQPDTTEEERERSRAAVIEELEEVERRIRHHREELSGGKQAGDPVEQLRE
jgi:hypothetical protein